MPAIFSDQSAAQADFTLHTPSRPLFVSLAHACEALGLSLQTGRNLLCQGQFPVPTVKIGARRLVPLAELEAFAWRLMAEAKAADEATKQAAATPAKRGHPGKAALLARRAASTVRAQPQLREKRRAEQPTKAERGVGA
ncbi:MAG: helix-turn-helix domain-containing protein [Betaproteobacteria bacterium]|nr:helix-turn-helix domain-containing protein [Betaproteobacteria bacterium]